MTSMKLNGSTELVIERRQTQRETRTPRQLLEQLPALVVLERLPVPMLAVGPDGEIVFANQAFSEMIGFTAERLHTMSYLDIFTTVPALDAPLQALRERANEIVSLAHGDGTAIMARLSRSAMRRADDPVVLMSFLDITEQLWLTGRK